MFLKLFHAKGSPFMGTAMRAFGAPRKAIGPNDEKKVWNLNKKLTKDRYGRSRKFYDHEKLIDMKNTSRLQYYRNGFTNADFNVLTTGKEKLK